MRRGEWQSSTCAELDRGGLRRPEMCLTDMPPFSWDFPGTRPRCRIAHSDPGTLGSHVAAASFASDLRLIP